MSMGIGAAAQELGTTVRTLRYYEAQGLVQPSSVSEGGHRRYDAHAVTGARRVLALRALGLPVGEIGAVLDADGPAAARVLREQQGRLAGRIAELHALRDRVAAAVADVESDATAVPLATVVALAEEVAMSVVINKVYTRTGDEGTTATAGPGRVSKADSRIEALGDVDEVVTAIGLAIAAPDAARVPLLRQLQNELFDLGADVADGGDRVGEDSVLALEEQCDEHNAALPALRSFVLPGAGPHSAALHHARAVCRRAERHLWTVPGREAAARYLNRLSDLLFILARGAAEEEPTWAPGTRA